MALLTVIRPDPQQAEVGILLRERTGVVARSGDIIPGEDGEGDVVDFYGSNPLTPMASWNWLPGSQSSLRCFSKGTYAGCKLAWQMSADRRCTHPTPSVDCPNARQMSRSHYSIRPQTHRSRPRRVHRHAGDPGADVGRYRSSIPPPRPDAGGRVGGVGNDRLLGDDQGKSGDDAHG